MVASYPFINDIDKLHQIIKQEEATIKEYEDWKSKGKPSHSWYHRSTGTWARKNIKRAKQRIKELQAK